MVSKEAKFYVYFKNINFLVMKGTLKKVIPKKHTKLGRVQ
jgi:hypothetical protein